MNDWLVNREPGNERLKEEILADLKKTRIIHVPVVALKDFLVLTVFYFFQMVC